MARNLKVYGGCYDGKNRVIVAAPNKKAAWEAVSKVWGISYYSWNEFTSVTGNSAELKAAISQPLTALTQTINARDSVFVKAVP